MKKIAFYTLGCKVNQYETDSLAGLFEQKGYEIVDFDEKADVYVINTCSVTNESARKSRKAIRRAVRKNPEAIVAVVGCYAQTETERIKKIPGVDVIIGTANRKDIIDLVEKARNAEKPLTVVRDIMKVDEYEKISPIGRTEKTRAFLKIQEGCSEFCSYCIIPYARGPVRSRDLKDIVLETQRLAREGFKEIVLTGINLVMYGRDLGNTSLVDVIERVHGVKGIERIRLSSIEPMGITEDLITLLTSLPKICPHFHIPLQSGSDVILKKMNRRYTTREYEEIIQAIREKIPEASITTDIIVGFPGETQNEFQKTYCFAKKIKFSRIHVFKYSQRKGTPASRMKPQVSSEEKRRRSAVLIQLSEELEKDYIDRFIGRVMEVIVEKKVKEMEGFFEGLTDNYIRVVFPLKRGKQGDLLKLRLIKRENSCVFGEPVKT